MTSLPVYQSSQEINSVNVTCQHVIIKNASRVSKRETIKLFPKYKKLITGKDFFGIASKSIHILGNADYSVQVSDDGCFDIIFTDCSIYFRVFTRRSLAIMQVDSIYKHKAINYKNVGRFIPSPLEIFVTVDKEKKSENHEEPQEDEVKDTFDVEDEYDFDYMFSNEIEPFVGGFKDVAPLLLV